MIDISSHKCSFVLCNFDFSPHFIVLKNTSFNALILTLFEAITKYTCLYYGIIYYPMLEKKPARLVKILLYAKE